jgi:hypothetical protein
VQKAEQSQRSHDEIARSQALGQSVAHLPRGIDRFSEEASHAQEVWCA